VKNAIQNMGKGGLVRQVIGWVKGKCGKAGIRNYLGGWKAMDMKWKFLRAMICAEKQGKTKEEIHEFRRASYITCISSENSNFKVKELVSSTQVSQGYT